MQPNATWSSSATAARDQDRLQKQTFALTIPCELADIKVREPDFEAMIRGKTKYLPPRYMTVNEAALQLLEVEDKYKKGGQLD
jgi:hypothetical protein